MEKTILSLLYPSLKISQCLASSNQFVIVAQPRCSQAACSACGFQSNRIHSYRLRTIRDMAIMEMAVLLNIRIRRFRCLQPTCSRKTFTEPLSQVIPYARRTNRLTDVLMHIGFFLGGRAGARLAGMLRLTSSYRTILRIVHRAPLPEMEPPRVVGVDDWALRRGQTYGTLIVDLERRKPLALFAGRSSQSLEKWLRAHTGIEVLTRDRSNEYARGMRQGAPLAMQVADRWHLIRSLQLCLERVCYHLRDEINELGELRHMRLFPPNLTRTPSEIKLRALKEEQRKNRYDTVLHLYKKGYTKTQIARELGITHKTVRRYLNEGQHPYAAYCKPRGGSKLALYTAYLDKRLAERYENASGLWRELKAKGYLGSINQVRRYVAARRSTPAPSTPRAHLESIKERMRSGKPAKGSLPSPQKMAWLLRANPSQLGEEERQIVE